MNFSTLPDVKRHGLKEIEKVEANANTERPWKIQGGHVSSDEDLTTIVYDTKKVFIVHGHDDSSKIQLSNFLYSWDLDPIVLHEEK
jgi:predicted nucleotide-binding protein